MGLLLPGLLSAQQATRVAYVDMQRLLDSAPQVAAARDRLAREFALRDNLLKADQARLQELELQRDHPSAALSADERQRLQQQIEALQRSLSRSRVELNEELSNRSHAEVDRAWPEISETVAAYARERGYDLVISSPVVYVSGRIDITEEVLQRMRSEAEIGDPP